MYTPHTQTYEKSEPQIKYKPQHCCCMAGGWRRVGGGKTVLGENKCILMERRPPPPSERKNVANSRNHLALADRPHLICPVCSARQRNFHPCLSRC